LLEVLRNKMYVMLFITLEAEQTVYWAGKLKGCKASYKKN